MQAEHLTSIKLNRLIRGRFASWIGCCPPEPLPLVSCRASSSLGIFSFQVLLRKWITTCKELAIFAPCAAGGMLMA